MWLTFSRFFDLIFYVDFPWGWFGLSDCAGYLDTNILKLVINLFIYLGASLLFCQVSSKLRLHRVLIFNKEFFLLLYGQLSNPISKATQLLVLLINSCLRVLKFYFQVVHVLADAVVLQPALSGHLHFSLIVYFTHIVRALQFCVVHLKARVFHRLLAINYWLSLLTILCIDSKLRIVLTANLTQSFLEFICGELFWANDSRSISG